MNNKYLAIITNLNVFIASGFAIAGLVSPQSLLPKLMIANDATNIFALYAAARTLPLAALVLFTTFRKSNEGLFWLGILAGFIQLFDVFVGIAQKDIGKSLGPFVIATVQFWVIYKIWNEIKLKQL